MNYHSRKLNRMLSYPKREPQHLRSPFHIHIRMRAEMAQQLVVLEFCVGQLGELLCVVVTQL